ncbi:MAG: hypothetical protein JNM63_10050, partial [Spirochaetia bacterium]|nr:hypothetical protein [Spirochaetia bacterium]
MKASPNPLKTFREEVAMKYQIYNSLFLTLPFEGLESAGTMLPLFSSFCREQLEARKSSLEIVDEFFREKMETSDPA